jgi:spermidine synthase
VKKWTSLDTALTTDGRTISLEEHDGSYTIRLEGGTLMSTRQHASEEKIAEVACAHLKGKRNARVLIGGLGFGYTLKAALAAVEPDAEVVVAEIQDAVIAWNRNPSYPLAAGALADPRVTVVHQDVADTIRESRGRFDSIILDLDNGPAPSTTDRNRRLYELVGLQAARDALRPEGCAAYWSESPNPAFEKLVVEAGLTLEVRHCRSRPKSGRWHTLFFARVKW